MADQNRLLSPTYGYYPALNPRKNALLSTAGQEDGAATLAALAETGLSIAPGSGEAISAREAWNASGRGAEALQAGNYGQAAGEYGNMLLSVAGAIPGAGIITRGTQRGAAWMDRNVPAGVNKLLDAMMPSDPKSQLNIFAGPNAKTADHAALAKAQEMAGAGANRDDIWRDTGWYQGVDGKWRFEIDDSGADLTDAATKSFDATHSTQGTASEIIDHPALWGAYPNLSRTATLLQKGPVEGAYFPTGVLHASAPDYQNAVSVNLHELQHGAQQAEDFVLGGNPSDLYSYTDKGLESQKGFLRRSADDYAKELQSGNISPAERSFVEKELAKTAKQLSELETREPLTEWEAYRRLAGETEARNVQSRINMSPADRRAKAPWLTQDVPDEQQIVRTR